MTILLSMDFDLLSLQEDGRVTDHPDSVFGFGPYMWQDNDFTTGYSTFFQFCDTVEVSI